MPTAKNLPVHWTSHACLVEDPAAPYPGFIDVRDDNKYLTRSPIWFGCQHRSRRDTLLPHRHRYSTKIADVTCEHCVKRYDGVVRSGMERRWFELPTSPVLLELDAHRLCCGARGAQLRADPRERLALARADVADLLVSLFRPALGLDRELAKSRQDLLRAAEHVPAGLEASLRPALNELSMACDLADEVVCMVGRARAVVEGVCQAVRDGELAA